MLTDHLSLKRGRTKEDLVYKNYCVHICSIMIKTCLVDEVWGKKANKSVTANREIGG